jgi:2-dehydro-3-deoxyphosphogluconate aldolase/(4S)-4-hydroxy-2-oxoglutarate aldolase
MSQSKISELIKSTGLVPVFNHDDPKTALKVIKACYDAGLRVFEWTNRGSKAFDVYSQIIDDVREGLPGMVVGAGTVFNEDTARRYIAKGASFIVSPVLDPSLAEICEKFNILWIPGTGTATEIYQASKWGADIIKVFPGTAVGGPGFIKAVRGPMPWVQLMPTGGVTTDKENLRAWFVAGVCCVGIGSKLFTRDLVDDGDPGKLIVSIIETLETIADVRSQMSDVGQPTTDN